jgi:hypothetical protein
MMSFMPCTINVSDLIQLFYYSELPGDMLYNRFKISNPLFHELFDGLLRTISSNGDGFLMHDRTGLANQTEKESR